MSANILMADKDFFLWFRKKMTMAANILLMMDDMGQDFALIGLLVDGLADTRKHVRKPFESWSPVRGTNPSTTSSVCSVAPLSPRPGSKVAARSNQVQALPRPPPVELYVIGEPATATDAPAFQALRQ